MEGNSGEDGGQIKNETNIASRKVKWPALFATFRKVTQEVGAYLSNERPELEWKANVYGKQACNVISEPSRLTPSDVHVNNVHETKQGNIQESMARTMLGNSN